jgi:hypothetical protein
MTDIQSNDSEFKELDGEMLGKIHKQMQSPEGLPTFSGMKIVNADGTEYNPEATPPTEETP